MNVEQNELVCNLRYARICDYIYSITTFSKVGGLELKYYPQIINNIKNDNREFVSIYCKTDQIINFFKNIKNINKKIILVTGCSDKSINKSLFIKKPKNIIKWYGENINYIDDCLIPIPLGSISGTWIGKNLEYCEMREHPTFKLININKLLEKKNLLFMCFSINTNKQHRTIVYDYFENMEWVTNLSKKKTGKYLNDELFINQCNKSYFIISPFGNGIDCGRTWIGLQLGCIPIIPYHYNFVKLSEKLPIILYNDINEITKEFLLEKLKIMKNIKYNYDLLKISYWNNLINNLN